MDQSYVAPAQKPVLLYDGRLGELYRIFLLNIVLGVVTLDFFRFRAVTRYRRYIWSHRRFRTSGSNTPASEASCLSGTCSPA